MVPLASILVKKWPKGHRLIQYHEYTEKSEFQPFWWPTYYIQMLLSEEPFEPERTSLISLEASLREQEVSVITYRISWELEPRQSSG